MGKSKNNTQTSEDGDGNNLGNVGYYNNFNFNGMHPVVCHTMG
jgi:hypothetical protein